MQLRCKGEENGGTIETPATAATWGAWQPEERYRNSHKIRSIGVSEKTKDKIILLTIKKMFIYPVKRPKRMTYRERNGRCVRVTRQFKPSKPSSPNQPSETHIQRYRPNNHPEMDVDRDIRSYRLLTCMSVSASQEAAPNFVLFERAL